MLVDRNKVMLEVYMCMHMPDAALHSVHAVVALHGRPDGIRVRESNAGLRAAGE